MGAISSFSKYKPLWSVVFGLSWTLFDFFWFEGYSIIASINQGPYTVHLTDPHVGLQPYTWIWFFLELFIIWVPGFPLTFPYNLYWYILGIDLSKWTLVSVLWFILSFFTATMVIYLLLSIFTRKK